MKLYGVSYVKWYCRECGKMVVEFCVDSIGMTEEQLSILEEQWEKTHKCKK